MRVADQVAIWMELKGITHAFGIIGGGNVTLYDAIAKLKYTQLIGVHHEQAAAMASTYFNRTRGNLSSVVLVTTGAGSSNAITGVLAAHMDGVPLLVISGNEASKYMDAKTRIWGVQGYDSSGIMNPMIGERCYRILHKDDWDIAVNHAFVNATTPRQGACWLDIPKDIANAMV